MNEHIEEWKRFAAAYMRWVDFSFDRIVEDVVKKHTYRPLPPDAVTVTGSGTFIGCSITSAGPYVAWSSPGMSGQGLTIEVFEGAPWAR